MSGPIISRRAFLASSATAATMMVLRPAPLLASDVSSGDWPSHGVDVQQTRHNPGEATLGPENVSRLQLRWEFEAGSGITATPAVIGDRVIVGSWDGRVYALDRRSGKSLWTFDAGVRRYPPDRQLGVFASPAVVGRTVYAVADRILALDIERGERLWERTIGDPAVTGEYFWAPPLAHANRLYAGVSGGSETETRGRIVCVDTTSGAVRWIFFTVASDVAGGALFAAPSLDPRTRTLYAATGSPFHVRPGPLRHSCSLIALDAATGALRWADQIIPHDTRNLDLNCPPMLLSVVHGGRRRDLIVVGGKDGIRAWDRTTRRRLWRVQLTPALPPGGKESLPTSGPETGPTAAAGGLVFFASNNHQDQTCLIAALEAATGELRWLHSLPAFQFGPMSVANGVVYLGLIDVGIAARSAHRRRSGDCSWDGLRGHGRWRLFARKSAAGLCVTSVTLPQRGDR
jgi:outer membrane protein assembly factor BamB